MFYQMILRLLLSAAGLGLASVWLSGVHVDRPATLFWAALLLGIANTVVRPVLVLLTLPATILTLGLFLLVINAAMLGLVSWMLPGFSLDGFWSALAGRALAGVGWAGTYMTGLKLLADLVDERMMARAVTAHAAGIGVSGDRFEFVSESMAQRQWAEPAISRRARWPSMRSSVERTISIPSSNCAVISLRISWIAASGICFNALPISAWIASACWSRGRAAIDARMRAAMSSFESMSALSRPFRGGSGAGAISR